MIRPELNARQWSAAAVIPAQAGIHDHDVSGEGDQRHASFCMVSGYGSRAPLPRPGMTQEAHLRNDLDQRDLRDAAGVEGGEVDVELVRIEAHRHVEGEARRDDGARGRRGGKGHKARRRVAVEA